MNTDPGTRVQKSLNSEKIVKTLQKDPFLHCSHDVKTTTVLYRNLILEIKIKNL
jgi:hypothetical protein